MKYLFVFAVVVDPLKSKLISGPPKTTLQILQGALFKNINSIAYYRAIMDGWNATHNELLSWIKEDQPCFTRKWRAFIKSGVLLISESMPDFPEFLPRPSRSKLHKIAARSGPGAYAAEAFLTAMFETIEFCKATGGLGVISANRLGASMDDSEYRWMRTETSKRGIDGLKAAEVR